MILFRKLYFEAPEGVKKPDRVVIFDEGINFVLGDRTAKESDSSEKMNSVGKSILIESINYCLLKKAHHSRISRIPDPDLDPRVYFCLDIEIESDSEIKFVTVKRNKENPDAPVLVIDGEEKVFESANDALMYIQHLFYQTLDLPTSVEHPSLRQMLSILIRDEDSKYKNILKPHQMSESSRIEDLLKPHLFLFQVETKVLHEIRELNTKLTKANDVRLSLKKDLEKLGVTESTAASYINDLEGSLEKLSLAIDDLKPSEAVKQKKNELVDLEIKLDKLISEKVSKEYLAKKIKTLPKVETVNTKHLQQVYNHFKEGLGDKVKKSFDEVSNFKKQVDDFQQSLVKDRLSQVNTEILELENQINEVDDQISIVYEHLDAREKIGELKSAVLLEQEQKTDFLAVSQTYSLMDEKKEQVKSLKRKLATKIDDLGVLLFEIEAAVNGFQSDLRSIHEYITHNQRCHYKMDIAEKVTKKELVNFDYSIKLDGGAGMDRIKTFIYDVLLMTNNKTRERHFNFLIHDNIFASTGRDDMVKSLNYLNNLSKKQRFQYILTINRDEFDSQQEEFDFELETVTKVKLTREDPFLNTEYAQSD